MRRWFTLAVLVLSTVAAQQALAGSVNYTPSMTAHPSVVVPAPMPSAPTYSPPAPTYYSIPQPVPPPAPTYSGSSAQNCQWPQNCSRPAPQPAPAPVVVAPRPTVSSPSQAYTFQPTQYGTVQVYKNGSLISTTTPQNAALNYGYSGAAAANASLGPAPWQQPLASAPQSNSLPQPVGQTTGPSITPAVPPPSVQTSVGSPSWVQSPPPPSAAAQSSPPSQGQSAIPARPQSSAAAATNSSATSASVAGMTPIVLGNGDQIYVSKAGQFYDQNGNTISSQTVAAAKPGTTSIYGLASQPNAASSSAPSISRSDASSVSLNPTSPQSAQAHASLPPPPWQSIPASPPSTFTQAANTTPPITTSPTSMSTPMAAPATSPPVSTNASITFLGGSVDPNKLNHIFGNPDHHLDQLTNEFGTEEDAFNAIRQSAQKVVQEKAIEGQFDEVVEVGSQLVRVTGTVVEGVAEIGTAFIAVP